MRSASHPFPSILLALAALACFHHPRCDAFLSPSRLSKSKSSSGQTQTHQIEAHQRQQQRFLPKMSNNDQTEGDDEQVMEALQSLGDFHQGSWKGRATSFTVTADVAAGIVQKKMSPEYQLDVQLMFTEVGSPAFQEICSWENSSDSSSNDSVSFASSRLVPFVESSVDCDVVDASYSLHTHATDNNDDKNVANNFPADLVGTSKAAHFAVEHCMAVSDDSRVRLLALYGEKQELIRVVICDEERNKEKEIPEEGSTGSTQLPKASSNAFTASDLFELQSDMDRLVDKISGQVSGTTQPGNMDEDDNEKDNDDSDIEYDPAERMQQLQDLRSSMGTTAGMAGSSPIQQLSSASVSASSSNSGTKSNNDRGPALVRHPMSLIELTSGVWLGDSIIRDNPSVSGDDSKPGGEKSGKGFGSSKSKLSDADSKNSNIQPSFGRWATGVQKVAREWLWDFGEQIRQNNEGGKALGATVESAMGQSMAGSVCENQSLSRRIPKDERMIYIDWNDGNGDNHVGFVVGSVSIQVSTSPLFVSF